MRSGRWIGTVALLSVAGGALAACAQILGLESDLTFPADGGATAVDGCVPAPTDALDGAIVFVTSGVYQGSSFENQLVPDTFCQDDALEAGLCGRRFAAWISFDDASTWPASRIDHLYNGDFVRPDGVPVAHGWADLVSSNLLAPIDKTANGGPSPAATGFVPGGSCVEGGSAVWTGTQSDGTKSPGGDCQDWAVSGAFGELGLHDLTDFTWTAWCAGGCDVRAPLYCVELPP